MPDRAGLERIKNYVGKHREISNWDDAVARTREINAVAFPKYTDEEWLRFAQGLYFEADGVPVIAHAEGRSGSRSWTRADAGRTRCR